MDKTITIIQKYLQVGHTQMEVHSMNATIERNLRNRNINVPAEYIGICPSAIKNPKPYNVQYLTHSFFKRFEDVKFYKSIRPGKIIGDPIVNDLRALKYTPLGDIFYKLKFSDEWKLLPRRRDSIPSKDFQQLPNIYSSTIPLTKRKYQDLQDLKITIPSDYHSYYNNLPYAL